MATIKQIQRRTAQGSWSAYDLGADSSNVTVTNPYSTSGTTATTSLQSFLNDAVNGNSATGKFTTEKRGMVPATGNTNTSDYYLNATGAWSKPINTTYAVVSTAADGLVPKTNNAPEGAYLDADGFWSVPPDTTYGIFSSVSQGLVPKTDNKDDTYYLNATGQWTVPPNTTYAAFTPATSAAKGTAGLVPSASSSVMATSNIIPGNNLSRYWLNVSGWQPIPSATTAQEGFMTPTQVTDLGNLKTVVGTETMGTTAETVKGAIAEINNKVNSTSIRIKIDGKNDPSATDGDMGWVMANWVFGWGITVALPVSGCTKIDSGADNIQYFHLYSNKTGDRGWKNLHSSLSNINTEIKGGMLYIHFVGLEATNYGYQRGASVLISFKCDITVS